MAHEGIFATKAECDSKAGENVDATGYTEANINQWCAEIESEINCMCQYNFSDNYATLNADVKKLLTGITTSYVALMAITYNMAGFTTRTEAEDMITVHRDTMQRQLGLLKIKEVQDFINGA